MDTLNTYIDHTQLSPETQHEAVDKVCREAVDNDFAGICIPPFFTRQAKNYLASSSVNLVTVIGFPLGYHTITAKTEEAKQAIEDGADELDMVMNIAAFKSGMDKDVKRDIESLVTLARDHDKMVKVIIETGLLEEQEIIKACQFCAETKADFVKTCTGFSGGKANVDVVRRMRDYLPDNIKIKASGGIKDANKAKALIEAGADRLGTSSGVNIVADEMG